MAALGHQRFAVVGHDTGLIISYALTADHPDRVERLVLVEVPGPPGVNPSPPLFVPEPINNRLWHIPFNRVNHQLTEQLVRDARTSSTAMSSPSRAASRCPRRPSATTSASLLIPRSCGAASGFYRAWDTTLAQNEQRKTRPLPMPVLAIGGADSWGEAVADGIEPAADDVHSVVIAGAGHWVAERAPQELLAALTTFLTLPRPRVSQRKGDHYDPGRALHGRYRRSPLPVRRSGRGSR